MNKITLRDCGVSIYHPRPGRPKLYQKQTMKEPIRLVVFQDGEITISTWNGLDGYQWKRLGRKA